MERSGRSQDAEAPLGVLMLDTSFPRFCGDVGNAQTWPFPVKFHVIADAVPARVVTEVPDSALLAPFLAGARQLETEGVWAITTSCGFLAIYQSELSAAVSIPVATSALLQVPLASRLTGPENAVGVLTQREHLTAAHFAGAGWSADELPVRVGTLDADALFPQVYLDGESEADPQLLRGEVVNAARNLHAAHPEIGSIVMECTNFVPFSQDVRRATGLPVFDLYTLVMQVHAAVIGTDFS